MKPTSDGEGRPPEGKPFSRLDNLKQCLRDRPELQEIARLMGLTEERIREYSGPAYVPPIVAAAKARAKFFGDHAADESEKQRQSEGRGGAFLGDGI
jgi:hypothetical protein